MVSKFLFEDMMAGPMGFPFEPTTFPVAVGAAGENHTDPYFWAILTNFCECRCQVRIVRHYNNLL